MTCINFLTEKTNFIYTHDSSWLILTDRLQRRNPSKIFESSLNSFRCLSGFFRAALTPFLPPRSNLDAGDLPANYVNQLRHFLVRLRFPHTRRSRVGFETLHADQEHCDAASVSGELHPVLLPRLTSKGLEALLYQQPRP